MPAPEKDPTGKKPGDLGAKFDADKVRYTDMLAGFTRALDAVAVLYDKGTGKYQLHGWQYVANGFDRYTNAGVRHLKKELAGETYLSDMPDVLHATAYAWNALARLELLLIDKERVEKVAEKEIRVEGLRGDQVTTVRCRLAGHTHCTFPDCDCGLAR